MKLLLLVGISIALLFGASTTAGADHGEDGTPPYLCAADGDRPAGYDGAEWDHYYGYCDETMVTTTTQAPTPTPEPEGQAGLPRTGGVALLGLAAGVAVTGLAIRRLATSS